jgi:hypothetical protein
MLSKLIKLMMLTTSSNDHEALSALRMANAMLAADNVNWEEFLTAVETTKQRAASSSGFSNVGSVHYTDPDDIDPMFDAALRNVKTGGYRDFIESVHEWWETNGFLTEKQYRAIRKAADQ